MPKSATRTRRAAARSCSSRCSSHSSASTYNYLYHSGKSYSGYSGTTRRRPLYTGYLSGLHGGLFAGSH